MASIASASSASSLAKLRPVRRLSHGVAMNSWAIAFTPVTAIHISVGEQVPKMLADQRRATARRVAA